MIPRPQGSFVVGAIMVVASCLQEGHLYTKGKGVLLVCASLLSSPGLKRSSKLIKAHALSRGPLAPYLASVATIFAPSRRAVRRS